MTAGKIALGCLVIAVLIFAADDLVGRFSHWRKRRDTHITAERMRKWNVTAFRAARKFDDPRWPI